MIKDFSQLVLDWMLSRLLLILLWQFDLQTVAVEDLSIILFKQWILVVTFSDWRRLLLVSMFWLILHQADNGIVLALTLSPQFLDLLEPVTEYVDALLLGRELHRRITVPIISLVLFIFFILPLCSSITLLFLLALAIHEVALNWKTVELLQVAKHPHHQVNLLLHVQVDEERLQIRDGRQAPDRVLVVREVVAVEVDDCDVAEDLRQVVWQPDDVVVFEVQLFQIFKLCNVGHQLVCDGLDALL